MGRHPKGPDPVEVASGRARATIEQLFALIHDVNPTDRGVSASERAMRYSLKARLQAVLVRRHKEVLEVVMDPADERVVSIRHRIAGRDACHAWLPSLDDDTRRWVETELALAATPSVGKGPQAAEVRPTASGSGKEALTAAEAAMGLYDYVEAVRLYQEAFDASRGGVAPARALLDIFVNHLADDAAALAVGARLSDAAATDPTVRGCLSVAAARAGDTAAARRWLKGAALELAAEALAVLVDHALGQGAQGQARGWLQALEEADLGHPALPRLRESLAKVRARERGPAESALAAAVAAMEWAQVETLANGLLERWPDCEPARAALRGLDLRRRAEMERAAALRAAELAEARVAQARALLTEGHLVEGLAAWVALPTNRRAELLQQIDRPELRWMAEMPAGEVSVAAALALRDARGALLAGDVDRAEEALEPHARALRGVSEALAIGRSISAFRDRHLSEVGRRALTEIAEARASGAFERALRWVPELEPGLRRRIKAEIEAEQERHMLRHRMEEARTRGEFLSARRLAQRLGDDAAALDIGRAMRRAWRVEVVEGLAAPVIDVVIPLDIPYPLPWLVDEGRAFVHVQGLGGWIFARVIDLGTLTVSRVVILRTPEPMRPHYWSVEAGAVSVVDLRGAVVEFRLADGDVLRWLPPPGNLPESDAIVQSATFAPGGRYVWMHLACFEGPELRVYDTERWPSFVSLEETGFPIPLLGCTDLAVARLDPALGIQVHNPNGTAHSRRLYLKERRATRVSVHPDGFALCGLVDNGGQGNVRGQALPSEVREHLSKAPIGFFWPYPDRINGRLEVFPLCDINHPHQLATSREEGRVYVKAGPGGVSRLHTYIRGPDGYLAEQPSDSWETTTLLFLTDADAWRVRAVARSPNGLRAVPLDGSIPERTTADAHAENYQTMWPMEGFDFDLGCRYDASVATESGEIIYRLLGAMSPDRKSGWIEEFKKTEAGNPGSLFDLAAALSQLGRRVEAEDLFQSTGARFPDHPRWRLMSACLHARTGEWDGVLAALDGVEDIRFEPVHLQHLLHLRGVARMRGGDLDGARADIRRAATVKGRCRIEAPLHLIEVLDGAEISDGVDSTASYHRSRFGPVVRGILMADRRLEQGDGEGAVASLDIAVVWLAGERQSLARLAEGWLLLHPEDPDDVLRRRFALANFLEAQQSYLDGFGRDLPIPPHTWGAERLVSLAERVAAALEQGS